MEPGSFDGNITDLLFSRQTKEKIRSTNTRMIRPTENVTQRLSMHSSLVRRLALEKEMKDDDDHGSINTIVWNSKGTLLVSGSAKYINMWSYSNRELIRSRYIGQCNTLCTKFVPGDERVAVGSEYGQVLIFDLSTPLRRSCYSEASANLRCHLCSVNDLSVEPGNPDLVWSVDGGVLRQHDLREVASCTAFDDWTTELCRSVLLDLRCGAKKSLASRPEHPLCLKSCDISSTRPYQLLVGGSDAFARLYDRRMLPSLSKGVDEVKPPPCVSYFCPMHLSNQTRSYLTNVKFSPSGDEVLLSYSGDHAYLVNVNPGEQGMKYTAGDARERLSLFSLDRESDVPPLPSASGYCTEEENKPEVAVDMEQKYFGHCNMGTAINQASFLGRAGNFVASGSEDGRCFIWEKRTGSLIKMLIGDSVAVNCVQGHPYDCVVATTGSDDTIKIWTPCAEVPSTVGPETTDFSIVIESNLRRLRNAHGIFVETDSGS